MSDETGNVTEEVVEATPLADNTETVIAELRSQVQSLEADKATLESRIGDLVRTSGEEKAKLESEYSQWGAGIQRYYEEKDERQTAYIADLERRLLEADEAGAQSVLDAKNAHEAREAESRAAREREVTERENAVKAAIKQASAAFGLEPSELQEMTSADAVWAKAGQLNRERQEELVQRAVREATGGGNPPPPQPAPEQQATPEPAPEARVPAPSANPSPARGSGARSENAELDQLREEWQQARKDKNLAKAFALQTRIDAIERGL